MTTDEITTKDQLIRELQDYLGAALEYIDAVPREAVSHLPMPGFGRDEAETLLRIKPEDIADAAPEAPSA